MTQFCTYIRKSQRMSCMRKVIILTNEWIKGNKFLSIPEYWEL